jgi:hypothetical protein
MIIDGSLRDWRWNLREIERIRTGFAYYSPVEIIFVFADKKVVLARQVITRALCARVLARASRLSARRKPVALCQTLFCWTC